MTVLWYWHWRLLKIKASFFCGADPGGHHFIAGVCHCGHRMKDDPESCVLRQGGEL
jgi:hypothetical protein